MTHAELMALPDVSPQLIQTVEVRDGGNVVTVKMTGGRVLFMDEQSGTVTDADGTRWLIGMDNGVRVRSRMMSSAAAESQLPENEDGQS